MSWILLPLSSSSWSCMRSTEHRYGSLRTAGSHTMKSTFPFFASGNPAWVIWYPAWKWINLTEKKCYIILYNWIDLYFQNIFQRYQKQRTFTYRKIWVEIMFPIKSWSFINCCTKGDCSFDCSFHTSLVQELWKEKLKGLSWESKKFFFYCCYFFYVSL